MSRGLKKFFIICAITVGVGLILSVIGVAAGGIKAIDKLAERYDWINGGPGEMTYLNLEEDAAFDSVQVQGSMDVVVYRGDPSKTRIIYGKNQEKPILYAENGVLAAETQDSPSNGVINLYGDDPSPTLELYCDDEETLKSLKIDIDWGDVEMEGIAADYIQVESSSGDIFMGQAKAGSLELDADYGDISLEQVSYDQATVKNESGDIYMDDVASKGLTLESQYGDVELYGAFTGTTDLRISSGAAYLETSLAESLYTLDIATESGDLAIGDHVYMDDYENSYRFGSGENLIRIVSEYGDVEVGFGR